MRSKRVISFIIIGILFVLYLIFKPFVISDFRVYFKKDSVDDYTLYQAPNLIDRGDDVEEDIYDDSDQVYYFEVPTSHYYRLVKGSKILTLEEALEERVVTPEELMERIDKLYVRERESDY